MSERPVQIVGLLCSSVLAHALGAVSMPAPNPSAGGVALLKQGGVRSGAAIAIATRSGEFFVWPFVRGAE